MTRSTDSDRILTLRELTYSNPPSTNHDTLNEGFSLKSGRKTVRIGTAEFGGTDFIVIAGPCAVESAAQIEGTARIVAEAGARVLRGGAFKARTSPYTFQGLGHEGIQLMRAAADAAGIPMITEVLSERDIEAMEPYVDAFQIGSRNMDNTALLKEIGRTTRPVMLKRGFAATISEWLQAAEYIVSGGNEHVILCERGIRTFTDATRFTFDIAGAVLARQKGGFPVIADPSHATGTPSLIPDMAAAALAAGLDGLMVEVHPSPGDALSDGRQALLPEEFTSMMQRLRLIAPVAGRVL